MDTLLLIIGIHAVLLGFAFVFAGFMVVAAPSKEETDALRAEYEAARAKSWFHGMVVSLDQARTARYRGLAMTIMHWPERPQGRMLVYTGLICLVVAASVGWYFHVFDT